MGKYNPEIVKDVSFIRTYMTENVVYHTDVCSFVWSGNTTYFMEHDIAICDISGGGGRLGRVLRFYVIVNGEVAKRECRFVETVFDQANEFELCIANQ